MDHEVDALCMGLIKVAKDTIDDFIPIAEQVKYSHTNRVIRNKWFNQLNPVMATLSWLSEPDRVWSAQITFNQCCDQLGLDSEVVSDKLTKELSKVHVNGIREIKRYAGLLLSDTRLQRKHRKSARGAD